MEDNIFMFERTCKKCGKQVFPTAQWVYREGSDYYCSWKCFNHRHPEKPKHEIIIPKVGDTIKIKYMARIPWYKNRVGKVRFFDSLGQMHGTWGELVVIPGEDIYKIVKEKQNENG